MCLFVQSCPTLCNPMDCSLPGSSVHGDSPGKNTGVGCHALFHVSKKVSVSNLASTMLVHAGGVGLVAKSCPTLATPRPWILQAFLLYCSFLHLRKSMLCIYYDAANILGDILANKAHGIYNLRVGPQLPL